MLQIQSWFKPITLKCSNLLTVVQKIFCHCLLKGKRHLLIRQMCVYIYIYTQKVHTNWFISLPTLPDRGFKPKGIVAFVVGDIVGLLSLFCVIQEQKPK